MSSLGIDFGSSYTTVSWINPRYGRPEIVKFNGDGSVKYPSVILGTDSGLVLGYDALSVLEEVNKLSPKDRFECLSNFIPSIKRILDCDSVEYIGDRSYSHMDLLTAFFRNIKDLANQHCGREHCFDTVTFSHPVEYENSKVLLMEQALRNAGFSKVKRELEPVAAVYGYSIDHEIAEREGILVFDFGGGTIDVAFVQKNGSSIKQLCAPQGNSMCGGQDFDLLIYEDLRKRILAEYDMDITSDSCIDYVMLNSCRRLKEHFSGPNDSYETSVVFVKDNKIHTYKYKLGRSAFNSIISPKVNEAVDVARIVVNEVRNKQYKIDKVLLIGGSSQLKLVKEQLSALLTDSVIDTCGEKDIAVALGNIYMEWAQSAISESNHKEASNEISNEDVCEETLRLDRSKSMKCKICGSEECYKLLDKRGYHCCQCGWEGLNIKVLF